MTAKVLLIDLKDEIYGFLKVATRPFMPVFDLNEVLENIFGALSVYDCSEDELTSIAIVIAYDVMFGDIRIEEADIPQGPHLDIFQAIMRMGMAIRARLVEYGAYLGPDGYFPYHFAEVTCDHLVRFTRADFEELSYTTGPAYFPSIGYRL